jgi:glycosyltransferase involved in cell wall biosynthesis
VNICHIAPIYLPGILPGCSKYLQDISEMLAKRSHHVTVLTANAVTGRGWVDPLFGRYASKKEEIMNGVRVKRLKTLWPITSTLYLLKRSLGPFLPQSIRDRVTLFSSGPYLLRLLEEFQREKYEVIHVAAFPFAIVWQVWKACKTLGKPFICTPLIHFEDPNHLNPLLWNVLQNAAAVIVCSNYEKEGVARRGVPPSRIHLIPMAIQAEGWKDARGERFRERYGLKGKRVILTAGTKDKNKGVFHLLQAVEKLHSRVNDLALVSIGLPTKEWEREKGRVHPVHLLDLGYVSEEEKRDAFEACDLFAMPSRYDSFGLVYLEAWRCAKPVIGARAGAIPEIIEEGKDGLLVEFGNVDQLASAILFLLDHPALSREMGLTGRRKVTERFQWQKNIEGLENAFQGARAEWR